MKQKLLSLFISIAFVSIANAQINPVSSLTFEHQYVMPNNFYSLYWMEPETPHGEIIGYNIYRNDDFYRFQAEIGVVHQPFGSNSEDFLYYGDWQGFYAHITAVYTGGIESEYVETIWVTGPALGNADFEKPKVSVYPNPTKGILNIDAENITQIEVYDISGKRLASYGGQSQIDLSGLSKGIYLVKLTSDKETFVCKIALE